MLLYRHPRIEVIVAGGAVRRADGAVIGSTAISLIGQFKVDYAIIGASAIDEEGALLDFDYREVQAAQAIIANARSVMLVADSTKLRRSAPVQHRPSQPDPDLCHRRARCPAGSPTSATTAASRWSRRWTSRPPDIDEPVVSRLRPSRASRLSSAASFETRATARLQPKGLGLSRRLAILPTSTNPTSSRGRALARVSQDEDRRTNCAFGSRFHLLSFFFVIYSNPKAKSPKRTGDRRGSVLLDRIFDLAIIGGGINGCGIARDAAGRGNSVFLCEMNDLASGTSSWSTKLVHGGLRYLEYYEFRLVREALIEREILWQIAPHIIRPLRFVLPHHSGLRPAWLLQAWVVPVRPYRRPPSAAADALGRSRP